MQSFAWVRNPLGILALFISLIYAMSAILFGTSVSALSPHNQTILTIFVVVFPVIVLVVFAWLVAKHHTKLYGPADYKDDSNFWRSAPATSVGERIAKEVVESEASASDPQELPAAVELPGGEPTSIKLETKSEVGGSVIGSAVESAYLAETLVVEALQRELGGSVRRSVRLGRYEVDAIVETTSTIYIVEVKVRRHLTSIARIKHEVSRRLEQVRRYLVETNPPGVTVRMFLAVVYDIPVPQDFPPSQRMNLDGDMETRVYFLDELKQRFGFVAP